MAHDFWVSIGGERGEEWKQALRTDRADIPVTSPIPILANLPGFSEPKRVYLVAIDQLKADEFSRIVEKLADKFGLSLDEAAREIEQAGIPILDDDCTVIVHNPQRWF